MTTITLREYILKGADQLERWYENSEVSNKARWALLADADLLREAVELEPERWEEILDSGLDARRSLKWFQTHFGTYVRWAGLGAFDVIFGTEELQYGLDWEEDDAYLFPH